MMQARGRYSRRIIEPQEPAFTVARRNLLHTLLDSSRMMLLSDQWALEAT